MASSARKLRAVTGGGASRGAPPARGRGRPKTQLTSAIGPNGSEREMLVILQKMLAKDLDVGVPASAKDRMIRQLLELDARIRGIDARAAEAEVAEDDDEDDDDAGWDPASI